MHVCFFNRSYWPDFGATGQLLTELAEDLVRLHGWQVTIVTGRPLWAGVRPPARERRNGVDIVRAAGTTFATRRFAGRAANYLTYVGSALLAGLRLPAADVVVAMTDPPIIGLVALAVARRRRAPLVFLCEDIFPEVAALLEDFDSPTVNRMLARVNRLLVRRAAAVVAIGETMKRRLVEGKGADPHRVKVIHNWVDTAAVRPGPRDNPFARRHALENRFVVLHAGNIGLSQSLDTVIDAAALLRQRDDVLFLFVGDGARKQALEARVRRDGLPNVRFLPYQPREAMGESYAAADVAVISLKAGLSGVIVPSKLYTVLASGRACVAAVEADCEVATIVADAQCGIVVPPGDAGALAAAIERMAATPEQAGEMGRRARETSAAFDRVKQVAAYDALLRGVAR